MKIDSMPLAGAIALAAVLGLFAASGCASVRPWQRELLAHRSMQPDVRPEESRARVHMLAGREGARGASGEAGGGCGCK